MSAPSGGTYTCGECGEHWPAGLHEVLHLEGCPACNQAWASVVPTGETGRPG
ncbi:MAG: hypothetical protein ABEJ74_05610 [Haloferacaceae archaeon]